MPEYIPENFGVADSLNSNNTPTTSPGAAATIAQIVNPPAGIYRVLVTLVQAGTLAVLDVMNMRIVLPSGNVLLPSGTGDSQVFEFPHVTLSGAQSLTVQSVAAGTVASVYGALISATQIG
jgi:hypothetical protein